MAEQTLESPLFLPHDRIDDLIAVLKQHGYRVIGPQVRDGAIIYDELAMAKHLPWGWRDIQQPGSYQLKQLNTKRAFAFSVGTQGLKPFLFKPYETVWRVERDKAGKLTFFPFTAEEAPIAFFGARSCDLRALAIQDKVYIYNDYPDKTYQKRRESLFLIAVNCSYSSSNCFCLSAGGSPQVHEQADLILTEIDHGFVIETASENGFNIISLLKLPQAEKQKLTHAKEEIEKAIVMQEKRIPKDNQSVLNDILFANLDHPQWDDVAARCLSCGNCTNSCPTCFCHTQVEKPDLDGQASTHERQWDSCFNAGHSYFARQVLRNDTKSRYKQWLTHKVGSWHDQFGCSGCVGCGRCIAWCPTGIDLTSELSAITGESNKRSDHDGPERP
ncbi:4Fe-4S dicluster domain-containing protein [Legionella sp. W05-934-2]|jgi:ferredoxin|uniref:4Fe-4S dicluster domain-containing protein n=1 Tax=Legionella sp. W05-934-2 TaxID=1198649 RepID=UPI003461C1F1